MGCGGAAGRAFPLVRPLEDLLLEALVRTPGVRSEWLVGAVAAPAGRQAGCPRRRPTLAGPELRVPACCPLAAWARAPDAAGDGLAVGHRGSATRAFLPVSALPDLLLQAVARAPGVRPKRPKASLAAATGRRAEEAEGLRPARIRLGLSLLVLDRARAQVPQPVQLLALAVARAPVAGAAVGSGQDRFPAVAAGRGRWERAAGPVGDPGAATSRARPPPGGSVQRTLADRAETGEHVPVGRLGGLLGFRRPGQWLTALAELERDPAAVR